ncbi:InlB B-repeat-containing protein [Burkholderia ambifaria]|nr:hypothetical protein [Burkholderia ambifaria]
MSQLSEIYENPKHDCYRDMQAGGMPEALESCQCNPGDHDGQTAARTVLWLDPDFITSEFILESNMPNTTTPLFILDDTALAYNSLGREARINIPLLKSLFDQSNMDRASIQIEFDLSDHLKIPLRTNNIEAIGDGNFIWHGSFVGIKEIQGVFSVVDLLHPEKLSISGHIHIFNDDFAFDSSGAGRVFIRKINRTALTCKSPPTIDLHQDGVYYEDIHASSDSRSIIDILVIYPPQLLHGQDGKGTLSANAVKAKVLTAKAVVDSAFRNSGINAEISIADVLPCEALKKRSVSNLLDEARLTGGKPGPVYRAISLMREQHHADIVAILALEGGLGANFVTAGEAILIPEPPSLSHSDLHYATFSVNYFSEIFHYAFAHEFGHLLGGKHDRITQPLGGGENHGFDYARGFVAEDYSFVTLMGYQKEHDGKAYEYIPAYSASDRQWQGKKMGTPAHEQAPADCAALFRWSTQTVANYRRKPDETPHGMIQLRISVEPQLGGFVTPSLAGPYAPGTPVTLTATPRTGHAFVRWLVEGEIVAPHR